MRILYGDSLDLANMISLLASQTQIASPTANPSPPDRQDPLIAFLKNCMSRNWDCFADIWNEKQAGSLFQQELITRYWLFATQNQQCSKSDAPSGDYTAHLSIHEGVPGLTNPLWANTRALVRFRFYLSPEYSTKYCLTIDRDICIPPRSNLDTETYARCCFYDIGMAKPTAFDRRKDPQVGAESKGGQGLTTLPVPNYSDAELLPSLRENWKDLNHFQVFRPGYPDYSKIYD